MGVKRVLTLAVILALVGCATSFSPDRIRSEIATQTGADPQGILEFTLGPTMLSLARTLFAAGGTETVPGSQPLAGLKKLQFAVYNLDPARAHALGLHAHEHHTAGSPPCASVTRTRPHWCWCAAPRVTRSATSCW